MRPVHNVSDARQGDIFPLCDKNDLISGDCTEMTGEMKVLPGEILMDEKDFHIRGILAQRACFNRLYLGPLAFIKTNYCNDIKLFIHNE